MITIGTSGDGISLTVVGNPAELVLTFTGARVPWNVITQQLKDSKVVRPDGKTGCAVVAAGSHQLLQACRSLYGQGVADSDAIIGLVIALSEACFWAGREIGRAEANAAARPMRGDGPLPRCGEDDGE
jgi:hypothetical protein